MTYALIVLAVIPPALSFYIWRQYMALSDLLNKANSALTAVGAKVDADTATIASLNTQLAAAQANTADPAVEAQISGVLDQIAAKVA